LRTSKNALDKNTKSVVLSAKEKKAIRIKLHNYQASKRDVMHTEEASGKKMVQ
jgi:hypothetical protein